MFQDQYIVYAGFFACVILSAITLVKVTQGLQNRSEGGQGHLLTAFCIGVEVALFPKVGFQSLVFGNI
jgi:hypothetical protein